MEPTMTIKPTAAIAKPKRLHASVTFPVAALLIASTIFAAFVALYGKNPFEVFGLIYQGGFGSGFAWQDTLARAAR